LLVNFLENGRKIGSITHNKHPTPLAIKTTTNIVYSKEYSLQTKTLQVLIK